MAAYDERLTEDFFITLVDIDICSTMERVWLPGNISDIHWILAQELLRDKGGGSLCKGTNIKYC